MAVEIAPATDDDFAVIGNLVPYYIYDMSEYMGWDCNAEGRWDGCDDLPQYWSEPDHHPYVIRVDGHVAGFALLRRSPSEPERFEIGEFFVARKFRGRGVGRECAVRLFDAFPGKWLVRVLNENAGARGFWEKVLREYSRGAFEQSEEQYTCPHSGTWLMQFYRFESRTP